MKRCLSLLLLFFLLTGGLSQLSACQTPTSPGTGGGTMDLDFLDHLDEYGDSLDFSSHGEFVISYAEQFAHEVYGEESSNEKLDTLVYNRNRLLEARFGLEIAIDNSIPDTAGVGHYNYVQLALNSGDVPFDAIAMNAYQAGKLIFGGNGNLLDLRAEVPYVRDSIKAGEEWWPSDINLDSTVLGRQFVGVSDFSITTIEMCFAVIFNKDLAKSTNVVPGIDPEKYTADSTLYDVVRGNDWTLENMTAIVKDYWRDNPSVGLRGEKDGADRFGMIAPLWTDIDAFAYAFGYNYIDNDGISEPTLWNWDGSQYDAIVALRELYYSAGSYTDESLKHLGMRAAFFAQQDRSLFMLNTLGSLKYEEIHSMEQDFGVLPYPKYTQSQARYLTGALDNYSALAIPYTLLWDEERLRMTGALLEALSAENCKSVKGAYYNDIVTHHNVTDGDSAEMINLIMAGRVYDLSMYHHSELVLDADAEELGAFALFFRYLVIYPNKDIVQYWESNGSSLSLQMENLLERYRTVGL